MASAGMFQLFNLPEMLVELQARRIATSNSFAFNSSSGKYLDLFAHLLQQHTSHIAGVSTRTPKTSLRQNPLCSTAFRSASAGPKRLNRKRNL